MRIGPQKRWVSTTRRGNTMSVDAGCLTGQDESGDHRSLRVVIRTADHTLVLSPSGELDVDTVATMPRLLVSVLEETHDEVRIDLSAVSFADTAAVDGLLRCQREAESRGRTFTLARPSPPVQLVLDLLTADEFFSIDR